MSAVIRHRLSVPSVQVSQDIPALLHLLQSPRELSHLCRDIVHVDERRHTAGSSRLSIWVLGADGCIKHLSGLWTWETAVQVITFEVSSNAPNLNARLTWQITPRDFDSIEVVFEAEVDGPECDIPPPTLADIRKIGVNVLNAIPNLLLYYNSRPGLRLETSCQGFARTRPVDIYSCLYEVDRWPEYLPHVEEVHVRDFGARTQLFDMKTVASGGQSLTSQSARIGYPYRRIAFKQTRPPDIFAAYCGEWLFEPVEGEGTQVSMRSTAYLTASMVDDLGSDASDFLKEITQKMRFNGQDNVDRSVLRAESSLSPH